LGEGERGERRESQWGGVSTVSKLQEGDQKTDGGGLKKEHFKEAGRGGHGARNIWQAGKKIARVINPQNQKR